MTIPSLSDFTSEIKDRLLCPGRVLGHYFKRTEIAKRPSNRLFVIVKFGPNIRAWMKDLIRFYYLSAPDEARRLAIIRVHEVRAIAAAFSLQQTSLLNSILENCCWRAHSTFFWGFLPEGYVVPNGRFCLLGTPGGSRADNFSKFSDTMSLYIYLKKIYIYKATPTSNVRCG